MSFPKEQPPFSSSNNDTQQRLDVAFYDGSYQTPKNQITPQELAEQRRKEVADNNGIELFLQDLLHQG